MAVEWVNRLEPTLDIDDDGNPSGSWARFFNGATGVIDQRLR
jgi:hypothetical protein